MRLANLALVTVLACSAADRRPAPPVSGAPLVAPGLRLPDLATPLAYELRLDLDPERESFTGEIWIKTRIDRPTDHVWLHADRIEIRAAHWDGGTLALDPVKGDQMRAFRFGRIVQPGTITIAIEYSGSFLKDQEGLFRQRAGDHYYVFSQGEAVYTRRFAPCFDEPRWKTPWRVVVVTPKPLVALSNMPEEASRVLDGNRKEIAFATTGPLPSYLVSLAVGPFDLVDAGTVGAQNQPVRVAVRAGAKGAVGVVAAKLPAVVAALEAYTGEPLPGPKLDIVAVPSLFGAMENPGLVTFDEPMVVGDHKEKAFAGYFVQIAAHEMVHQWFGNLVTPAWWNDLWLSEAFASWLGDKVARELGAIDEPALRLALARRRALDADREPGAVPLRRPIGSNADPDESFDAIYEKGQVVLGTFEAWLGEQPFRDVLRGFLKSHRDANATAEDLARALGDAGPAFQQFVTRPGAPVVELALRCEGKPVLAAHVRDGRSVPICVRQAGARADTCTLVSERTELALPACPAWVIGNTRGGYYDVAWTTHGARGPAPKLAQLDPSQRIFAGDDLASAIARGELSAKDALAELRALSDPRDAYAQLGAIAIAARLDERVPETSRAAWSSWLAARFATRLAIPGGSPAEQALTDLLIDLVPAERFPQAATRRSLDLLDSAIADGTRELPLELVTLAAASGGYKLFSRIADRARLARDPELRDGFLAALGRFGPGEVEHAIDLLVDPALPADAAWAAVAGYFERGATRASAWRALRPRLPEILKRMTGDNGAKIIDATAGLCDAAARAEVVETFASRVAAIPVGKQRYTAALAAIDGCIASAAKLGDFAAALAASR